MATYLRLFDPTQQFQLKNGALNVSGRLYVYLEGTDDYADLYDENGSQLQQPVVLDNNGRSAGLFVDSKKTYWMKVNDQYDGTIFTIRKMTPCGGGGGSVLSGTYNVISSDQSVNIEKSVDAGNTTFDLSVSDDGNDLLEWIRCDGDSAIRCTDIRKPVYTEGTMEVGYQGIKLIRGHYYHVTAHVRATKNAEREPWYDTIRMYFSLYYGQNNIVDVTSQSQIIDYSLGLTQEYEISTDVIPEFDCELLFQIAGQDLLTGGDVELVDIEAHRIYSGSPAIPSGVLSRAQAAEIYQRKLIAGENITITETEEGDVISSTGGGGGGATYQGGDGIIVNNTTYQISIDDSVVQEKLTAGNNITIEDNVISATVPSVDISGKADKVEDAVSGNLAGLDSNGNLTDSGIAADRVVTDPDYVHTDNNFTDSDKSKLAGIEAGAQANVQSDWTESDSSSDAYIQHKPDLSVYATDTELSAGLATKQDMLTAGSNITIQNNVISATAATQEQSDWTETDTSDVSYIKNKPGVKPVVAGNNITITEGNDSFTISATVEPQVQADWNETDSSDPSYIQNKPDLSVYATTQAMNTALAGKQDVISDLATIRSGASLGATATQPSDLATVATTGSYNDLINKPTIPSFDSTQMAAINSGVNSTKVGNYDAHIVDTDIHVTTSEKSTWNAKQDAISDLSTIRSGAQAGSTAVQPGELATVATSGDYDDLLNKPTIPAAQVNSDWNSSSGVSQIMNKPDLSVYATQNDLSSKQDTLTAGSNISISNNVISATDTTYSAGTGLTLTGTTFSNADPLPTHTSSDEGKILKVDSNGDLEWTASGGTQVQSDWTESDTTDPSYIQNKPLDIGITEGSGITFTNSGTSVSIGVTIPVPSFDPNTDVGKVLTITSGGVLAWVTP